MNATEQLKRVALGLSSLFKNRELDQEILKRLEDKLDIIISKLDNISVMGREVKKSSVKGDVVKESKVKGDQLYIPSIDLEGMEVCAQTKNIKSNRDLGRNLDKLKDLEKED